MASDITRLQALEMRSANATAVVAHRIRGQEAAEHNPHVWSGDKGSESFTASKMGLHHLVGSLQGNMIQVMEVAETKDSRVMELDDKSAGMSQETEDDFKATDRRLYQVLIICTLLKKFGKNLAKNCVCNPERSEFQARKQMVSQFDPGTGADSPVAYAQLTHLVSHSGLTWARPKTLPTARGGRV